MTVHSTLLYAAVACGLALGATLARAEDGEFPAELLADALSAAEAGRWEEAAQTGRATGSLVAVDIVLWTRLRDGVGDLADYTDFLERRADWPGLERLRRQGERALPAGMAPEAVFAYFEGAPALSGTGAIRVAEAHLAEGRAEAAEAEILRAWTEMSLSEAQEREILEPWGELVAPAHETRLDMLLWRGWHGEARRMLGRVGPDWRALAEARMAVRNDAAGLQALIAAVPASLRDHPGLHFERYLYRTEKGRWEEAEEYMLAHSASAETLGEPDMWMPRRANLARQALRRGDVADAYAIAGRNFGESGADYADAEWLAEFIALVEFKDPQAAIGHFERFGDAVSTPVSRGRAGFWLGLAHERAGDDEAAAAAYALGAEHQTSFYGQLAAARGGLPVDPTLTGTEPTPDWRTDPALDTDVVAAGRLLIAAGDDERAKVFLRHFADDKPAQIRAAVAQMAIDLDRTHIAVRIAKDAAADGVIIPAQYYPLASIAEREWPVPTEYAMAIARQESELNPSVVSHAGARGLMQLLPGTAEHVARDIGVPYAPGKLTTDPIYNARLGTAYLAGNLQRFGGSYILATAAYNAGPGRVAQWVREMGDPRMADVDPIVWIESIPYEETRNYVMRVMEALHVYRARLNGVAGPIGLVADINRTG